MRATLHGYMFGIVDAVATRGTCDRGRVGCVIAYGGRVVATGYAGAPRGLPHCDEVGHDMVVRRRGDGFVTEHCVRTVHAEANAIVQAAQFGTSIKGAFLYCSTFPCVDCAKLIINSGIVQVLAQDGYSEMNISKKLFEEAGVSAIVLSEFSRYTRQVNLYMLPDSATEEEREATLKKILGDERGSGC